MLSIPDELIDSSILGIVLPTSKRDAALYPRWQK
jgi:hypothetical protein